jgi:hypothetical protein
MTFIMVMTVTFKQISALYCTFTHGRQIHVTPNPMASFGFNPYVCGVLPSYFMEEIHSAKIEDEICFTRVRNSTSFTLVPL